MDIAVHLKAINANLKQGCIWNKISQEGLECVCAGCVCEVNSYLHMYDSAFQRIICLKLSRNKCAEQITLAGYLYILLSISLEYYSLDLRKGYFSNPEVLQDFF